MNIADTPTPPPQEGTWVLIAPDGRRYEGLAPLACVSKEQRERVPAQVALARIMREVEAPEPPATPAREVGAAPKSEVAQEIERIGARIDKKLAAFADMVAPPSPPVGTEPMEPNNDEVICPACCHQFRAIPVNVQQLLWEAGAEKNRAELLAEDIDCLHRCLDEAGAPRADAAGAVYSMWGRVMRLPAGRQEAIPDAMTYARRASMAVTKEWARGWDDCLARALAAAPTPPERAEPELPDAAILDIAKTALGWAQDEDWLCDGNGSAIHVDDLLKVVRAVLKETAK